METHDYQTHTSHKCPYCQTAALETVATAPFVRGFILAVQHGSKSFIGCVPCVRKKLLGEAGLSALLGWFSITALIINPFMIVYNLIQAAFLKEKKGKVKKRLRELGIPADGQNIDITNIGYALAISMIKADGKVDEEEIEVAEKIGERIFPDFDEAKFRMMIQENTRIPSPKDLALILKDSVQQDGKALIFQYLTAIAEADGTVDPAEKQMLSDIAYHLEIVLPQ